MKAITKSLVKGVYYLAKFAGQVGGVVKEGVVDGYYEACKEIKQEECPFEPTAEQPAPEPITTY